MAAAIEPGGASQLSETGPHHGLPVSVAPVAPPKAPRVMKYPMAWLDRLYTEPADSWRFAEQSGPVRFKGTGGGGGGGPNFGGSTPPQITISRTARSQVTDRERKKQQASPESITREPNGDRPATPYRHEQKKAGQRIRQAPALSGRSTAPATPCRGSSPLSRPSPGKTTE